MISLEVVKSSHDKYSWSDTLLEDVYNVILSHNDCDEFNLYKIIIKPVCITDLIPIRNGTFYSY